LTDFSANAAWAVLAAISQNILRAAGALASLFHARARGATLRRDLINVPASTARTGRGDLTLRGIASWYAEQACLALHTATRPRARDPAPRPCPGHGLTRPKPRSRPDERPAAATPPSIPSILIMDGPRKGGRQGPLRPDSPGKLLGQRLDREHSPENGRWIQAEASPNAVRRRLATKLRGPGQQDEPATLNHGLPNGEPGRAFNTNDNARRKSAGNVHLASAPRLTPDDDVDTVIVIGQEHETFCCQHAELYELL